jgi:hypothetical protein
MHGIAFKNSGDRVTVEKPSWTGRKNGVHHHDTYSSGRILRSIINGFEKMFILHDKNILRGYE